MRYYYDCRIWEPGKQPMTFSWANKRKAIAECKSLLAVVNYMGRPKQFAAIFARPRGVIRVSLTRPRLRAIWRGNSTQYRFVTTKSLATPKGFR